VPQGRQDFFWGRLMNSLTSLQQKPSKYKGQILSILQLPATISICGVQPFREHYRIFIVGHLHVLFSVLLIQLVGCPIQTFTALVCKNNLKPYPKVVFILISSYKNIFVIIGFHRKTNPFN